MVRRVIREEIGASAPGRDVDLLTLVEAATLARNGGTTIQLWLKQGRLTRYGTPRRLLISRRELMDALRHEPAELSDAAIEAQAAQYARGG
ncbi:hypothetical protein ACLEPN_21145 [Myxococcus sp. 1LA]